MNNCQHPYRPFYMRTIVGTTLRLCEYCGVVSNEDGRVYNHSKVWYEALSGRQGHEKMVAKEFTIPGALDLQLRISRRGMPMLLKAQLIAQPY